MTPIPDTLADALRAAARARRASTEAWGRGARGREWLAYVQAERVALARVSDAAIEWDDSTADEPAAMEGQR